MRHHWNICRVQDRSLCYVGRDCWTLADSPMQHWQQAHAPCLRMLQAASCPLSESRHSPSPSPFFDKVGAMLEWTLHWQDLEER